MSRSERIAELVKEEISSILRTRINDPRIGFVSITDVEVSHDLKHAKIFVSVFGDEKTKFASMQGLESATAYIRGELGKILELRETPEILFKMDDSLERGSKLISLMNRLKDVRSTHKN